MLCNLAIKNRQAELLNQITNKLDIPGIRTSNLPTSTVLISPVVVVSSSVSSNDEFAEMSSDEALGRQVSSASCDLEGSEFLSKLSVDVNSLSEPLLTKNNCTEKDSIPEEKFSEGNNLLPAGINSRNSENAADSISETVPSAGVFTLFVLKVLEQFRIVQIK
jgi:hypothetical protein